MSSDFGKNVRVTIFGQSHSAAIGAVLDGLPAGEAIDFDEVRAFMRRRAPGRSATATQRSEADLPEVVSGIVDGHTCGAPLCAIIRNTDTRSGDYDGLKYIPRPSHADYTAWVKYHGFSDVRGGGHFSGRLTAPLCFAGAVCLQILARRGIRIAAHVYSIAGIRDSDIDMLSGDIDCVTAAAGREIPAIDEAAAAQMRAAIMAAKDRGDSVGGVVECVAAGVPAGLGEPMFGGMESRVASVMFGVPAVRGVEFGLGFAASQLPGSRHNDPFAADAGGRIVTGTNNHGGILGGITSGMPLVCRVAFKPTASVGQPQQSVDLRDGKPTELNIVGRHDPCIVPRAVPCVEAAMAAVVLDSLLDGGNPT